MLGKYIKYFLILSFYIIVSLNSFGQLNNELPEPLRVVQVSTSAELTTALSAAMPGDHIILADGNYPGSFTISVNGTETNPIIVKASNKLRTIFTGGWTLEGNDTWLWGLDFDGQNGIGIYVSLKGQRARLQRCRFRRFDTPGDAPGVSTNGKILIGVNGTDQKIYYCEFTEIDGRCISGKSNGSTPMRNTHIYRCYFHDYIKALGNANGREAIQSGQTQVPEGIPVQITIGAIIEECLFQNWNIGGDDENETISIKSSGNTVKACTFLDVNLMNVRFGNNNRIESCWFEKVNSNEVMGVGIYGDDNVVIASKFVNGAYVNVNSGTQTMQQGSQVEYPSAWDQNSDFPLAKRTRLIYCEGILRIGNNNYPGACENTSIEAHLYGTIYVKNIYPGTWYEYDPTMSETGTKYYTTSNETRPVPPLKLLPSDVGPYADCTTETLFLEKWENNKISFYPNPTEGNLIFDYYGEEKLIKLTVKDIKGRKISSHEYFNNGSRLTEHIALSEFPDGFYIIKIVTRNSVSTFKLLKI